MNWIDIINVNNTTPIYDVAWLDDTQIQGDVVLSEIPGVRQSDINWSDKDPADGNAYRHRMNPSQYTWTNSSQYDGDDGFVGREGYGIAVRDEERDTLPAITISGSTYRDLGLKNWQDWMPVYNPYTDISVYLSPGQVMVNIDSGDTPSTGFTNQSIVSAYLGLDPVDRVYLGNEMIYPTEIDYMKTPFTMESLSNNQTIKLYMTNWSGQGIVPGELDLEMRINGGEWQTVSGVVADNRYPVAYTLNSGDTLQFRGHHPRGLYNFRIINDSGYSLNLYGNINSLLEKTGYEYLTDISSYSSTTGYSAFAGIFHDDLDRYLHGVVNAKNLMLPATTIGPKAYYKMFKAGADLVAPPTIIAYTLGNSACAQMFQGCTSLVNPPYFEPTTLSDGCCSNMFTDCTSLTGSPRLVASTLVTGCYVGMFSGCSSLSEITCLATNVTPQLAQTGYTNNWVTGVPTGSTGSFRKHSNANWYQATTPGSTRTYGIPYGWTVQDYVGPNNS